MIPPCHLCGGLQFRTLEVASDGVRTLRCAACQLIFLHPFPGVDPAVHYDEGYYRPWRREQAAARHMLWRRRLDRLERHAVRGALLDVGCGEGGFLRAARDRGWQAVGTEVSRWAVKTLRDEEGFRIHEGDLAELTDLDTGFDAVTMWHVLEHTRSPLATLAAARTRLRPGGVLVVAVPNAAARLLRAAYFCVKRRPLRYYTPADREVHLYHFTASTLRGALQRAGFEVIAEGVDRVGLTPARQALELAGTILVGMTGLRWSEALLAVGLRGGGR
jgi:SAM-dependent methyltransferase